MEGEEQLMVVFVQKEQKESLDFQKHGVSFILGPLCHRWLCRAEGGGVPAPEVRTGQSENKFRVTLKDRVRKYHC